MIALLTGKPLPSKSGIILDVRGVGYLVLVPQSIAAHVFQSELVTLHIYTHVREESLELYGFITEQERELFVLLLSVSGVGPKTALGIVEQGSTPLISAVQQADVRFFSSIPRIGKKLAQKIIIELKSKLGSLQELDLGPVSEQQTIVQEALLTLGFDAQQIEQVVRTVDPELSAEKAIQEALKHLS